MCVVIYRDTRCISKSYGHEVYTVMLFVESALFGLFTICILGKHIEVSYRNRFIILTYYIGEQVSVLTTNEAKIDRLKSSLTNTSTSRGSFDQYQPVKIDNSYKQGIIFKNNSLILN